MQQHLQHFILCLIMIVLPGSNLVAQGVERFTLNDFDLSGPVKQCDVLTAYGKEEFHFNTAGMLTKAITRYNENDFDVTHYRYEDGLLSVKRDEVYRDGDFDSRTSLAHFYTRDSVMAKDSTMKRVLKERILSYDKEINELNEFYYDPSGKLVKRVQVTEGGIDEVRMSYQEKGDTLFQKEQTNDILSAIIKEFKVIRENGDTLNYKQNTAYLSEIPDTRTLEIYDNQGNLIEKRSWKYQPESRKFSRVETFKYNYNEQGVLKEEVHSTGKQTSKKEYIYQFDNDNTGNWVKQIILPDNAYVTRRITYYPKTSSVKQPKKSIPER